MPIIPSHDIEVLPPNANLIFGSYQMKPRNLLSQHTSYQNFPGNHLLPGISNFPPQASFAGELIPDKGKRNKSIEIPQSQPDHNNTLQSVPSDYSKKRLSMGESTQLDHIGLKKSNSID